MPRLFFALDLPENLRGLLASLESPIPGARWIAADQRHLTLRFIGELPGEELARMREVSNGVHAVSFPFQLKGTGIFPSERAPRVLWVGVSESEPLLVLRNRLEESLIALGLDPEERPYRPHVTLARLDRRKLDRRRIVEFISKTRDFSSPQFEVASFQLYESRQTSEGVKYHLMARFPFEFHRGDA